MKKFTLIVYFFLISFGAIAQEKIAIVDIDFLLKNSKKGISIKEDFDIQNKKFLDKFKKKEKELKDKEMKISNKKNVLSEEDFNKEVKNFTKEVEKYNLDRKNELDKINKKRNQEIVDLLKKINLILVDYSKEKNLSTVMDKKNVIITKSENDITKSILELLNKR